MASTAPYEAMEAGTPKTEETDYCKWPREFGILVLRLTVCSLVVHHGLQKMQNVEGFSQNTVMKYFPFLVTQTGLKPEIWTQAAAAVEIGGSAFLALGIFSRLAAFALTGTMVFANAFHFMFTGLQGYPIGVPATGAYAFEPSLLCGAIFFFFLCNGPGKLALQPSLC